MNRVGSSFQRILFHSFILLIILVSPLSAKPIGKNQAKKAVRSWLRQNQSPMDCAISDVPVEDQTLIGENGQVLCHIINLIPEGFVIFAADDEIEPVIAFSCTGFYDGDQNNPLTTLLKKDMTTRLNAVPQNNKDRSRAREKSRKWQLLLDDDEPLQVGIDSLTSVSDVWVDPFVQSLWNQGDVWDSGSTSYVHCYNYYTPYNYPTGCVATAMAQVLRYYTWPASGIGYLNFTINVDGVSQTAHTLGGNGSGGPYNWAQMPIDPQSGVSLTERQMIGALCYDAGISVGMSYYSGSSSASLYNADQRLSDTFDYAASVYTTSFASSGDDRLWNILSANLDAQMPVILGISRTGGGHAVIADGYGYNGDTLYHHINMGWGGSDNAWYQLPLIDAYRTYTAIDDAVYNIYPSGGGEIISGRVTNIAGVPLAGVDVKAYYGTLLQKQTVTNSRGVYALTDLTSNRTYTVTAEKTGEAFPDQSVTTGNSSDWSTPGNRSGICFQSVLSCPPTAYDIETDVDSTESVIIQLQVLDDGIPDPNLMRYIVTSLPVHGQLSEPNVGPIDVVPYAMIDDDENSLLYMPCPYFGGQDTFTYKANDGGTAPTGGDSNIATVTVNVNNQLFTSLDDPTNTYSTLLMNTETYYDARAQIILFQSEIGQAQPLTDLALDVYIPPGGTLNNWTIRMQHTDWTYYPTTQDVTTMFLTSGWTTLYQDDKTINEDGWNNFHFDQPFEYNGTQNLLIDISFNNNSLTSPTGKYWVQTGTGTNRFLGLASQTGTHGDPLNWDFWAIGGSYFTGSVPNIKLIGEIAIEPIPGDFDATCNVKLPDVAIFSQAWQTSSGDANYNAECDLTAIKGSIDLQDLIILSDHWLQTYP
jgi:hypothetical protein